MSNVKAQISDKAQNSNVQQIFGIWNYGSCWHIEKYKVKEG